ncbi:MAG TPA: S8/S53 family peptidase [Candidatus Thermoplasmatota archaeon]|nr:S8/S53 family peptidase [Candidatus Thermoplasmatota archaeon]
MAPAASTEPVVIAVLDSGIRSTHAAFAPGQVVAWHDFTNPTPRAAGPWDGLVPTPYDDVGHGTAVASLAAGATVDGMTRSHAPGARLVIGKVLRADGTFAWADLARAIRWSVDVAHADVVSVSLYGYAPEIGPAAGQDERAVLDALAYARDLGALPVVLAGNGAQNAGIPTMSWLHAPSMSVDALVVGGAHSDGTPVAPRSSLEPEVTANYTAVAACADSDRCLRVTSGTSFATPLVAGAAARLVGVARALGADASPDAIESLLKASARDTAAPPPVEGYGFLGWPEIDAAEASQRAGGSPRDAGANGLYVEDVQDTVRRLWSQTLLA